MAERSPADYAIEHAEYLAQAVEAYMEARNAWDAAATAAYECDDEELQEPLQREADAAGEIAGEHFNGLRGAVYEFRKRAERVERAYSVKP